MAIAIIGKITHPIKYGIFCIDFMLSKIQSNGPALSIKEISPINISFDFKINFLKLDDMCNKKKLNIYSKRFASQEQKQLSMKICICIWLRLLRKTMNKIDYKIYKCIYLWIEIPL